MGSKDFATIAAYDAHEGHPWMQDGTVWLRGHLDETQARAALVTLNREWDGGAEYAGHEHDYARTLPIAAGDAETSVFHGYAKGPGAYPVTIVALVDGNADARGAK